jgi:hypothetical protein
MSSISSISSLLSQYLLGTGESSSIEILTNATADSDITDKVSLSSESQNLLTSLLSSLGNTSTETDYSSGSMYDVLMSAANTKLIKSNPGLVKMILSVEEAETSQSTSSSISSGTFSTEDINLITMSSSDLLSIIKKYKALSSSKSSTTTSSQIDETV